MGVPFDALINDTASSWLLTAGPATVRLECPWRIIASGGIAITSSDHDQQFGLPAPIDAGDRAASVLKNRPITLAEIDEVSGDLHIHFGEGIRFEAWNSSSGYEGWSLTGPDGLHVVAQGGGELAIWRAPDRDA